MKYENRLIGPLDTQEMRLAVEELGRQGFELVSSYATREGHFASVRRPEQDVVGNAIRTGYVQVWE